jgi:hypothetical protein
LRKRTNPFIGGIVALCTLSAALLAMACADTAAGSQASNPLEKLTKLQGHWTYAGRYYATASRHAGPSRGVMDCDVLPNKGYVSCDILSSIPDADTGVRANYLSLFSYSPSEKSYLHFVITNDVSPLGERLTIDGDRWVSHSELSIKGKTIMLRDLFVFLSADKLDQTSQFSTNNGRTWVTRWHAIAVKA